MKTTVDYQPVDNVRHNRITITYDVCKCGYEREGDKVIAYRLFHEDADNDGNCDLCSKNAAQVMTIQINGVQIDGGEIAPNGSFVITGTSDSSKLTFKLNGNDVTRLVSVSTVGNQITVSPGSRLWNPDAELVVEYEGRVLATINVDAVYSDAYAGKKVMDTSTQYPVGYAFTFQKGGEVIASFCLDQKFKELLSKRVWNEAGTETVPALVITDNGYHKEAKVYGTCEAGTTVYLWYWYEGNSKYPRIYCEYEQYPERSGDAVVLEYNGAVICEVEFYCQDKRVGDLDETHLERLRLGVDQGFESIRLLYGDEYFDKLVRILRERNGDTPIKIFIVDTDYAPGDQTAGMNIGDLGVIYVNADTFFPGSTWGFADTVSHEFQHYCWALTVGNNSFINESFSETVGAMTAGSLSEGAGMYGFVYQSRNVVDGLKKNVDAYTHPETGVRTICGRYDSEQDEYTSGLLKRTTGNYTLYAAFGYYLMHCSEENTTHLHLDGGMNGLLDLVALETSAADADDGDHLGATFRALYKGFTGRDGNTETAETYFMETIIPDFQIYIKECVDAGQMQ